MYRFVGDEHGIRDNSPSVSTSLKPNVYHEGDQACAVSNGRDAMVKLRTAHSCERAKTTFTQKTCEIQLQMLTQACIHCRANSEAYEDIFTMSSPSKSQITAFLRRRRHRTMSCQIHRARGNNVRAKESTPSARSTFIEKAGNLSESPGD